MTQVFLRTTAIVGKRDPLSCILVDKSAWKKPSTLQMLASAAAQMR